MDGQGGVVPDQGGFLSGHAEVLHLRNEVKTCEEGARVPVVERTVNESGDELPRTRYS